MRLRPSEIMHGASLNDLCKAHKKSALAGTLYH
jgi:hypothetical protein